MPCTSPSEKGERSSGWGQPKGIGLHHAAY